MKRLRWVGEEMGRKGILLYSPYEFVGKEENLKVEVEVEVEVEAEVEGK